MESQSNSDLHSLTAIEVKFILKLVYFIVFTLFPPLHYFNIIK